MPHPTPPTPKTSQIPPTPQTPIPDAPATIADTVGSEGIVSMSSLVRGFRTMWGGRDLNLYLFIAALICSLYDTVSTVLCMNAFGYDCEANVLLRWVMQGSGMMGFIGVKLGVTLIVLGIIYYLITNNIHLGMNSATKFYGVYLGVILSNAYVGTSNVSVILKNGSLYFLSLNSMQMALVLIFVPAVIILLFDRR